MTKTGYPYGFQGLRFIEKWSDTPGYLLNNHNIGQTKELENALIFLCRNSGVIHIIHNQNQTQAADKTATAASIATNATSRISNTSITSTSTNAFDSITSSLIYANKITVFTPPSSGISSSSFPFSNEKIWACLTVNCLSNQLLISFSHSSNKITASFEFDSLIGLLTNYALINSQGK